MKTKLVFDRRTLEAMGFTQNGYPPYIGYSEVNAKKLQKSIDLFSTKREVEKNESKFNIEAQKDGDLISLFGIGSDTFYIGRYAKQKQETLESES